MNNLFKQVLPWLLENQNQYSDIWSKLYFQYSSFNSMDSEMRAFTLTSSKWPSNLSWAPPYNEHPSKNGKIWYVPRVIG